MNHIFIDFSYLFCCRKSLKPKIVPFSNNLHKNPQKTLFEISTKKLLLQPFPTFASFSRVHVFAMFSAFILHFVFTAVGFLPSHLTGIKHKNICWDLLSGVFFLPSLNIFLNFFSQSSELLCSSYEILANLNLFAQFLWNVLQLQNLCVWTFWVFWRNFSNFYPLFCCVCCGRRD